ncbi:microbial collagenase [Thermoactinomyces sp. DSM 45891]|uniref:collagenase n=1 Tax=Thermoactinomyces sp. DSM 45891 TaxID=1761907 RepID=UPI0009209A2F|nr:collagenase [Thermoactinomyces sp. DSM 45891]SFW97704.1 microbial collagenase [Thermoactinomyces sp. DSM 45891]
MSKRAYVSLFIAFMMMITPVYCTWGQFVNGKVSHSQKKTPMGKIQESTELQLDHTTAHQQKSQDLSSRPPQKKPTPTIRTQADYPMSYLVTLNHNELINLLSTITWSQIPDLFEFNQDSYQFYRDSARVQAIINALGQKGTQFTSENNLGIPTLVEVLRSGFFLGFYYSELSYLNQRTFHDRCLPALKSIARNSNFMLGTTKQDQVIASYAMLIGNASSDVETVNLAVPILSQYRANINTYLPQYSKGNAVYTLMSNIDYELDTYMYDENVPPEQTPWYGKINPFIEELGLFALLNTFNKESTWLINNGIYYVSRLGSFHSQPNRGNQVITASMKKYPQNSEPYLTAAVQIKNLYNSVDADGRRLNLDQILGNAKQYYLPKSYTFDNGSVVFKTGGQVTEEKVLRLYWASKEVKSQFHRITGRDTEIEKGNPDDILTIVIYSNPDEYKLNRLLYGFNTDNGGIYIESIGTFFTYERTPAQSVYSLEELFRHEVTHYFQGRYSIPGMFGDGPFYEGERLTWFEEGSAEFFAGSTRTSGVQPRKTIVKQLAKDPADRYTVSQTLHAKYGSWDFYNYAFAFQSYMYTTFLPMLDYLNNSIIREDVRAYDQYIDQLSRDQNLNTDYQNYMQKLINQTDQLPTPHVSDIYLSRHPFMDRNQVYSKIKSVINLSNVATRTNQSFNLNTFTLRGTYTLSTSKGKYQDWKAMNQRVDQVLVDLNNQSWSGYKTVTTYFVNYRVNNKNQAEFDVVFHGVLTD